MMNCFTKKLSKICTNTCIFFYALMMKGVRINDNDKVLIICDGLIGDTVLSQDFLRECSRFFCKFQIELFVTLSTSKQFYIECCKKYDNIRLVDVSIDKRTYFESHLRAIKYFRDKKYKYVINPLPLNTGDKLVGCIKGKKKITIRDVSRTHGGRVFSLYKDYVYTDTLYAEVTENEFCRRKRLLNALGDSEYITKLPELIDSDSDEVMLTKDNYCIMSIGASEEGKKYGYARYAHIANHIISSYGFRIICVGGTEDKYEVESMKKLLKNKDAILDYTGKTSFSEWVSLIRHAKMVIGNDSASIHIAAATGTKSVCVVGRWQYKRFYPYIIDEQSEYEPVPIFCLQELECENCGKIKSTMPRKECRESDNGQRSYYCLSLINEKEIINIIDSIFVSLK